MGASKPPAHEDLLTTAEMTQIWEWQHLDEQLPSPYYMGVIPECFTKSLTPERTREAGETFLHPAPSSAQEDPSLRGSITYHKDEDSEFRPVQFRSHLPGDAVLPISSLPHLPLHKAAIQAPAGTARAPASHF